MTRLPTDAPVAARSAEVSAETEVSPDFQRECVEFFADVVQVLGVPRSVGQIYGLLFASPRPLSFTDIAEKLDVSRGSASQGLQFLRDLGAVRNVSSPEHRRDLYEPELGLRKLVSGVLREKVDPIVTNADTRVRKLQAHAKATRSGTGRKFSEQRIKQLETWRRQMRLLLPLLKTILGPGRA